VEVFKAEAKKLKASGQGHKCATFLAQGTIYPDVVESGGTHTKKATIKSHHNVGGLPATAGPEAAGAAARTVQGRSARTGRGPGLAALTWCTATPSRVPGLGVRILGEVKPEFADLLKRADAIFIEELRKCIDPETGKSWYDLTSQAFTVFLPVKSVGVMGDGRTYEYVVSLRAVQTSDFMTADSAELPYSLLKKVSGRIINEVRGINRVAYDVSSKPPATIEWE
jgi:GMP synthase (glutamine-hydrolysing)